jgi:hypothetical protein
VRFTARPDPAVLGLATADDVFVIVGETGGIGRARADLQRLRCAVATADLDRVLRVRERSGGLPGARTLDVSASVLGRRAFNRYDLEDTAGEVLAGRLGLPYRSRRAGARPPAEGLSWRVTVVDDRATLALRIPARPLHRRPYKAASVPGTLHPPLAAAMLRVARSVRGRCCSTRAAARAPSRSRPLAPAFGCSGRMPTPPRWPRPSRTAGAPPCPGAWPTPVRCHCGTAPSTGWW